MKMIRWIAKSYGIEFKTDTAPKSNKDFGNFLVGTGPNVLGKKFEKGFQDLRV